MAYLSDLRNDVFISYSHADNERFGGWVDTFHDRLKTGLQRELGHQDVSVWRDRERAERNRNLNDLLGDDLKQSALLAAVTSPAYLDSDWCVGELGFFAGEAGQDVGLEIGGRWRILRVSVERVPKHAWRESWGRDLIGYEFHDKSGGGPFEPDSVEFRDVLRRLIHDMARTLEGWPAHRKAPKPRVFLAEVHPDLEAVRQRVESRLLQRGCRISTDIPPPTDKDRHRETVASELNSSNLAIHVLDDEPGQPTLWDAKWTYPQEQVLLALDQPKRKSVVLVPDTLDLDAIENEEQKSLLSELERHKAGSQPLDFIRVNRLNAPQLIEEKLSKLGLAVGPPDDRYLVLVISHPEDDAVLRERIKDHLDGSVGDDAKPTHCVSPPATRSPDERRVAWENLVSRLHGALAIWDGADKDWVEGNLMHVIAVATEMGLKVPALGVLVTGPTRDTRFYGLRMPVAVILATHGGNGFDPGAFDEFLALVRG